VVNNVTYSFNLTIVNVGYTSEKAANVTKSVLAGDFGTFDLFFGPYSSGLTTSVALQLEAADTVMLTAGATSSSIYSCAGAGTLPNCKFSGQRRFQNTWGTLSIAERYYSSILALLRNRGARNIAVWAEAAAFPQSIKNGVKAEAANQRMNITFEKNIPDSPNATILSDLIDELSQRPDVDAVIAGTYYDTSVSFVRLAKQKNWVPKALVTRIGEVSIYRDLGDDARYLMDSNYWDSRLHGDDYIDSLYFSDPSVPAPLQFANAFQAKWGELPGQVLLVLTTRIPSTLSNHWMLFGT
jgi:ABC-type branched-subunit amino acid transport system substrate-binding protein